MCILLLLMKSLFDVLCCYFIKLNFKFFFIYILLSRVAVRILKLFNHLEQKFYLKLKREHIKREIVPSHSALNLLGKNSKGGDDAMATIISTPYTPFVYRFFSFMHILLN